MTLVKCAATVNEMQVCYKPAPQTCQYTWQLTEYFPHAKPHTETRLVSVKNVPAWNTVHCRCLWRFTADNLNTVQGSSSWQCPCCRPPPALALQYPPRSRQRTSLQLDPNASPHRPIWGAHASSTTGVDSVKRRSSRSGASSPREVLTCSTQVPQQTWKCCLICCRLAGSSSKQPDSDLYLLAHTLLRL